MDKKTIEVTMLDRRFTLAVDESEDFVRAVASRVDELARGLASRANSDSGSALLAALQLGIEAAYARDELALREGKVEELLSLL